MYSVVIENTLRPGKKTEFLTFWSNEILPVLKRQSGFVEATVLTGKSDSNLILGINFWKTESDAEDFFRNIFPEISGAVSHLFEYSPTVRTFAVEASSLVRAGTSKAA